MSVLPDRLKTIRESRGLTQRQLAKLINISPSTIALYETGDRNPDPNMLKKLADVLDCSVDWLLGRVALDESRKIEGSFNLDNNDGDKSNEILAAHRTDDPMSELPEEARRSLEDFKEYILKKYGMK